MAENIFSTPSGSGGLTRYNESYKSNLTISPTMVTVLVAVTILGMAALKLLVKRPF